MNSPNGPSGLFVSSIVPSLLWTGGFGLLLIANIDWPSSETAVMFGYIITFCTLAACVIGTAWIASLHYWPRATLGVASLVGVIGVGLFETGNPALSALLRGTVLMVLGGQVGSLFGRGIQSSTHIWPLVIVAVCVDAWSVLSAQGISHALVVDEALPAANPFLLFSMPVPGIGVTPVLGVADLLFSSLLVSAFRTLDFPLRRAIVGISIGFGACLLSVCIFELPIPALIFIAPFPAILMGRRLHSTFSEIGLAFAFVL